MFLKKPELTAGSRPSLFQDEALLFVQDGVGLYEGSDLHHPKITDHMLIIQQKIQDRYMPKGACLSDISSSLLC